jgi:hypothetical protein
MEPVKLGVIDNSKKIDRGKTVAAPYGQERNLRLYTTTLRLNSVLSIHNNSWLSRSMFHGGYHGAEIDLTVITASQ